MALLNDPKYMIYTNGYPSDQLRLGHLILGNFYHDPVDLENRRCLGPELSAHDIEQGAFVSDWSGTCVASKAGRIGFGLDLMDLLKLSPRLDWTGVKVIEAGSGTKVVLKDPTEFLRERVLSGSKTRATVKRWLSTSRTNSIFRQFPGRRPKIWMLTGLYELGDVRSGTITKSHPSLDIAVSSNVMTAATGVSVGPSIEIGRDSVAYSAGIVHKRLVYAARYQLLRAKYPKEGEIADERAILELHPDDIYCKGYVLGDEGDDSNDASKAKAGALTLAEDGPDYVEDDDLGPDFWKAFDRVDKMFKRREKGT